MAGRDDEGECIHIHDGEGKDIGFICRSGRLVYIPRVHRTGAQKYELLKESRSLRVAMQRVTDTLIADRGLFYNRGDVLGHEPYSYYGPHLVFEVRR